MKLLLYCCKHKPYLLQGLARPMHTIDKSDPLNYKWCLINHKTQNTLNGKIVAECDYTVEIIERKNTIGDWFHYMNQNEIMKQACIIDVNKFFNYLGGKNGYAIHIKNLRRFKPKELNEVYSIHNVGGMLLTDKLKKAPQNMQRISIKEWEYGTYNPNDVAILISIHPEWLCKILNGEKTIEIRKKVLKEML